MQGRLKKTWFKVARETEIDYYHQKVKSLKCLDSMLSNQPATQKPNFDAFRLTH